MLEQFGMLGDRILARIVPRMKAAAVPYWDCWNEFAGPACRECCRLRDPVTNYVGPITCGSYKYPC